MQTINISLPLKLSHQVDHIVTNEGYASKSEFFRTLIRLYCHLRSEPSAQNQLHLTSFKKQPLNQIKTDLKTTKKYSNAFINSVISGLEKSSVYQ